MCHAFFRKAVRIFLWASLTCSVFNNPVAARTWEITFLPNEFVTAKLMNLEPGEPRPVCPAGCRPMRVASQIDLRDNGQLTVGTSSPEHYKSTKTGVERIRENLNPKLEFDLIGCAFLKHFLPQSGHIDLSGTFGTGEIKPTRFHFQASGGENDAGFWYRTQLAGSLQPTRLAWNKTIEAPAHLSDEKILGTLWGNVSHEPFAILSGEYANDFVEFDLDGPRIIVVSAD
jgi:hypothetical protein